MKLANFFEIQQVLDNHILDEHKELIGQDNLDWKILSLQVELGECANEWRGFKKWSNRQTPKMYPRETCDYCGEETDYVRPTPFMADIGSSMCKVCWSSTKEEYAASNSEYIPAFEDYQHFPNKQPTKLLEEFVDCLHFILSIGLESAEEWLIDENYSIGGFEKSGWNVENTIEQFQVVFNKISDFSITNDADDFIDLVSEFLGLGEMLGLSWEQIKQAYFEKNAVNHQRQVQGY